MATLNFDSAGNVPGLTSLNVLPTRMLFSMEQPVGEDAALMLRYQAGEARAFDLLYARHKGALYRYLLRHVRNAASANDLFQEVWMRVISNRARYTPRAKFATFLFHIAHNCAIDHHRRAQATPIDSTPEDLNLLADSAAPEYQRPDRMAEYDERLAAFEAALAGLPGEQREAFLLHEESGLEIHEIAQVTQVGVETAKSRVRYAVSKLKRALRESARPIARAV